MTDLTERLRECPFCGGEAKLVSGSSSKVQCQKDQCIIGDTAPFNDFSHRQDAIAAWNKRPTLETLTQENARLREALEGIVTGDVERVVAHVWRADGKPSKLDQCAHDVQINHDCPSCIEDHARKALGGGGEQ